MLHSVHMSRKPNELNLTDIFNNPSGLSNKDQRNLKPIKKIKLLHIIIKYAINSNIVQLQRKFGSEH